jgi:hypothetical protein
MDMTDMNAMDGDAFDIWLSEQAGTSTDDEILGDLFSKVMREEVPEEKAKWLVEAANHCLAMADRTLGAKESVATCLTLTNNAIVTGPTITRH